VEYLKTKNLVKNFVKNLALLITESSLYPAHHPSVIAQTKQTLSSLIEAFEKKEEIALDVFEGQMVFEGIPFYELKHVIEKPVELLDAKNIKSLGFKNTVTAPELAFFISLLVDKKRSLLADDIKHELQKVSFTSISVESAKTAETDDAKADLLPFVKIYGRSIEANKLVYNTMRQGAAMPLDIIDKVAGEITNMIVKDSSSSLALSTLRDYDEYTFTHSTNVAILSIALASRITKDKALLNNLARAALLHDIGKIYIPLNVLNKPDKLTDDEWGMMKQHPIWGAKILEQQQTVDKLSVLIAVQHHMRFDLTGYPKIPGINNLHPLSLVVNICDIYDAITSKRPYKKPMPADKALAIMLRLVGCDFNPQYLKIFTQLIGVYPPGSFVQLNTGEVGIVKKIKPQALILPEIKIILDKNSKLYESPLLIDLSDESQNTSKRHIESIVDPTEIGLNPVDFF